MKRNRVSYRVAAVVLWVLLLGALTQRVSAYPADKYAGKSKLAEGTWAKIRVNETGMQLITSSQLRNLGFSNPSKVRVYGYGGRMIDEVLHADHPDDLPLVPSVVTDKGVVFFGVDRTTRVKASGTAAYSHSQNPYSLYSYYFISDVEAPEAEMAAAGQMQVNPADVKTTFTAQLIHEQELQGAANTGRTILGEDFRARTSQNFAFAMPGKVGEKAGVTVCFGSAFTNGTSSLQILADSEPLQTVSLPALNDKVYANLTTATVTADAKNDKLDVQLKFTAGGALSMARLDYIEVEYEKSLALTDGELFFYDAPTAPGAAYTVSGCSASTVIWDVTEPHAPKLVNASLEGDRMTFATSRVGYCEFVAFDAARINRSVTPSGKVENQNIHGMETPDMIVITPTQYYSQAERVAELHRVKDGMRVYTFTPEQLYNEFSSGTPDVSAFRKAMKMWYDRGESEDGHKLGYCLIMSRPTYDNLGVSERVRADGYPRVPIWQSAPVSSVISERSSYSTDDFIAMLEDQKRLAMNTDRICVAVGRMPVKSADEATLMVNKLVKYVESPSYGSWRNQVMLIADDQDSGIHLEQSESMAAGMVAEGNGADFIYEKLYCDAYQRQASASGFGYPEAEERMNRIINNGCMFMTYIGHASPNGLSHEKLFDWTAINSMTNRYWPIMYAATCEFLRWDNDEISGAEVMWLYPEAGVISMMAAVREVYIQNNGNLSDALGHYVFRRDADGKPMRMGDILASGKNELTGSMSDTNKLRFALMGDPAMRIASPELGMVVDKIGDVDIETADEFPEIHASDKVVVTGRVVNADGETCSGFNGVAEVTLFDAERVVETYGNGKDGEVSIYNDRNSPLCRSKVEVTNGEWSVTLLTPPIIDNNYSPAQINMYAYSDELGIDANGACERLYVYGVANEDTDDTQGPEISDLLLNSPSFQSGDIVNVSPVLMADIRDESGVSIYGTTIGQELSLKVDDRIYTNVADYFTPAVGDPCAGSVMFPLDDVEPGEHTLVLTAYDNVGNYSEKSVQFKVAVGRQPGVDVTTDVNPATTSVTFIVSHDRPSENLDCLIEVFDLSGRRVWSAGQATAGSYDSSLRMQWNLHDNSGNRVARGIYLYRATITDAEGFSSSKTRKLAVTAQ